MTQGIEQTSGEGALAALHLVCAVSDKAVLHRELLASEPLRQADGPMAAVHLVHGARSAAAAVNPALERLRGRGGRGVAGFAPIHI